MTYTRRMRNAKILFREVFQIRKMAFGEEHTFLSIGNLAPAYWNQSQRKNSEELKVHVMEMKKRVLGDKQPDTPISMSNLTLVLGQ